jgi:hypothetical protein
MVTMRPWDSAPTGTTVNRQSNPHQFPKPRRWRELVGGAGDLDLDLGVPGEADDDDDDVGSDAGKDDEACDCPLCLRRG